MPTVSAMVMVSSGSFIPPIVRQYITHEQIKAAIAPNAATLKSDYSAVKTARQTAWRTDLIAGNSSAVQTDVQALETAQNNLSSGKGHGGAGDLGQS